MKKGLIGIELGSKNLRIYSKEKDQILRLKNVIALTEDSETAAVGNEAFSMYEKEPHQIQIITPMVHGVIGDYTNMRRLLAQILRRYLRKLKKYEFYMAVPSDITGVERRAFYDLMLESFRSVKEVRLCPKPMADAVGLGIDVGAPCGNMVINMGADTTEISVISLGGIVRSRLVKQGGSQIDQWMISKLKRNHNIEIGMKSAERLKLLYARREEEGKPACVKGRDLVSGLPKKIQVPGDLAEEKVRSYVNDIIIEAKAMLEVIPPELASDIMVEGIYLSGGSSSFQKIPEWMEDAIGIHIRTGEQPEESVVRGLKTMMNKDYKYQ